MKNCSLITRKNWNVIGLVAFHGRRFFTAYPIARPKIDDRVFDLSVVSDVDTASDVDDCRGKLVDINVPTNESLASLLAH